MKCLRCASLPDLPSTLSSLCSNPASRERSDFFRAMYVFVSLHDWDAHVEKSDPSCRGRVLGSGCLTALEVSLTMDVLNLQEFHPALLFAIMFECMISSDFH